MKKIGLVSLGCSKNLVDSEMIMAMFRDGDYSFTSNPAEADLIIVNTCGFIEAAKKEAINTILEMSGYKGKLVAVGCFVERNLKELQESIPEVDLWVPIRDYPLLAKKIESLLGTSDIDDIDPMKRLVSTPSYSAYLRISEGCDNFCSFCAIPYIRGRMVSRPFEEVIEEAKGLKEKGVKEISLVSQDPMHYGKDFGAGGKKMIDLLKALDSLGFYSIRLLYLYPEEITDEELVFIKNSSSIAHYFDVPIQCASDHLLKLMNRHGTKKEMLALFHRIKELMPDAVLRTTLISGFPGENEEDQKETIAFMNEVRFDHLGDFTYSKEEGTAAAKYKDQLPAKIKKLRQKEVMSLQRKISYENNRKRVGEVMEGLVTGYDESRKLYTLRSYWNAPDDIDGNIYFTSPKPLKDGDVVKVLITGAYVYDLMGELRDEAI